VKPSLNLCEPQGEKYMSTTDQADAQNKPAKPNKFAEARLAKKKQRRKAHRLTIKRSNTGG
jgi:hypothetical protein